MNFKKMERYLRVNLLGPAPRLIKKRIYRAAVSQRLRNTVLDGGKLSLQPLPLLSAPTLQQFKNCIHQDVSQPAVLSDTAITHLHSKHTHGEWKTTYSPSAPTICWVSGPKKIPLYKPGKLWRHIIECIWRKYYQTAVDESQNIQFIMLPINYSRYTYFYRLKRSLKINVLKTAVQKNYTRI